MSAISKISHSTRFCQLLPTTQRPDLRPPSPVLAWVEWGSEVECEVARGSREVGVAPGTGRHRSAVHPPPPLRSMSLSTGHSDVPAAALPPSGTTLGSEPGRAVRPGSSGPPLAPLLRRRSAAGSAQLDAHTASVSAGGTEQQQQQQRRRWRRRRRRRRREGS